MVVARRRLLRLRNQMLLILLLLRIFVAQCRFFAPPR
jgi:hypothetical protein